jgi:nitrogen regulatory protein P-II 1
LKLVIAVIRPERLEAVQQQLAEAKVFRMTVSDVQGFSPRASSGSSAAAAAYAAEAGAETEGRQTAVRKVKLEIAVNEDFVEPTVRRIVRAAQLEEASGAVFVLPLEEAVRIRTGERGPDAI